MINNDLLKMQLRSSKTASSSVVFKQKNNNIMFIKTQVNKFI